MKPKKTLLITIIALLLIMLNVSFIYAEEGSASIEIVSDTQNAKVGQTVTFKVYLNNIVSELGMGGLQGALNFSEEFDLNTIKVTGVNGCSVTYTKENKYFALLKDDLTEEEDLIKAKTEIMEVSVKIKEDATIGSKATMAIIPKDTEEGEPAGLAVAEAYYDEEGVIQTRPIETSPATASVTVSKEGGTTIIPDTTPSKKPVTVNSPKATTPPSKLPQTGISDNPAPVLFGALVVVLISYVAYRRYKEI